MTIDSIIQLLRPDVPILEMILRGTLIYLGLFALLRLLRRPTGQLGIADLLLITILADASQNAMGGAYESIGSGGVLILTIVFWDQTIDRLSYRYRWFSRLAEATPELLIESGRIQRRTLARLHLSEEELHSQLRQHGVGDFSTIRRCYLEPDGHISVQR